MDKYIGDGVYVGFDGYHVVLKANVPVTDTIYLDPHVARTLYEYLEQLLFEDDEDNEP